MTNSTDSLERFVYAVRTDLKTWPRLLPLGQPMPAGSPSRDFAVAFFLSLVIHALLAFLFLVAATDRVAVETVVPSNDTPLIISLSRFAADSHDGMDREAVPGAPQADQTAQRSQSSPEPSSSAGRESEAEIVVTSKDRDVPGSETVGGKSPATGAIPSFNPDTAYRIAWKFVKIPEFEAETVVTSIGRGIPGSEDFEDESPAARSTSSFDLDTAYRMAWEFVKIPEFKAETVELWKGLGFPVSEAPGGKTLAAFSTPSFGLEAFYRIEREFGGMSEAEIQDVRIRPRILYINDYIAEIRALNQDCRTAYSGAGLLAILPLIKDAITGNGCKWGAEIKELK